MTIRGLAEASGVATSTISKIENNRSEGGADTLEKLAKALNCRWKLITD